MNKTTNYDTKSSLLSIDYKIPYDTSQSSRIVQHLQQSQQQLQFLKQKLTQAYQKLQKQIKWNIQLSDNNQQLINKVKHLQNSLQMEQLENLKLKEVMEKMLHNRKIVEEQIQYTHKRYKRILHEKDQDYQSKIQELEKFIRKLKRDNEILQQSIQEMSRKQSVSSSKISSQQQKKYKQRIQILETQIKKLTTQKVAQVSRLKHQIQCYQRNISPIRTQFGQNKSVLNRPFIQYFDVESNNQNTNMNIMQNSTVIQSKVSIQTKTQQDSVSKWQKSKVSKTNQLSDDQKLTRAQMEKKKIQNQLMKIQRLKRHGPEDRQAIADLQKKIYDLDSQISCLKRKIRQKY